MMLSLMFLIRGNNTKIERNCPLLTNISCRASAADTPSNGQSKGKGITLSAAVKAEPRVGGCCVEDVFKSAIPFGAIGSGKVPIISLLPRLAPRINSA
jgi:hypothetical protein